MTRQEAWANYLKTRPSTATEQDDFEAGWNIGVEHASDLVEEYLEDGSYYRAGPVIRRELLE